MHLRDSRQFRESLKRDQIKIPDKEVNFFIHHVEPKVNKNEDYQKVLAIWNQYAAHRRLEKKQANSILSAQGKGSPNSMGSNLCQICYEEITRKRGWCRICGHQCCEKCATRLRVIGSQVQPVLFCDKCDKEYMVAMIVKEEEEKFVLREKAFLKLAEEQQMIESLLKIERNKIIGSEDEGAEKNVLLAKMNQITQLSTQNQSLKHEISEVQKKIEWGQDIKIHLKKKLKKLKKDQSHSFTSSVHDEHEGWAPPRADAEQYVSLENLNESIINSILENETHPEVKDQSKCNCSIF